MTSAEPQDPPPDAVDVVIPCWGSYVATLAESIASAAGGEVLVVGDEAAAEVAGRLGARFVQADRPERLGRARNQGIRASRSSLVCCLDADDRLLPGALERMRAALVQHPRDVAVVGRMRRRDGTGLWPPTARARLACTRLGAPVLLWKNSLAAVGACLVRREAIAGLELFPDLADEDWHAAITIRAAGPVRLLDEPLLDYAMGTGSLSRRHRDPHDLEVSQEALLRTALRRLERDRWWWTLVDTLAAPGRRRHRRRLVRRWRDVSGR